MRWWRDPDTRTVLPIHLATRLGVLAVGWWYVVRKGALSERELQQFASARLAKFQVPRLWEAIGALCRLDRPDPIAAWEQHLASLAARRDFLNARRYTALKYAGPGTSLTTMPFMSVV